MSEVAIHLYCRRSDGTIEDAQHTFDLSDFGGFLPAVGDKILDPGVPASLDFGNFVRAWTVGDFAVATWNSLLTTVVSSVLTVAIAAPCAYYLSRVDNKLTRGLSLYFILGLGIPAQVILIPLFVMLNKVYLTDSIIGLNLVYIGVSMPFTVFLLTAFFRSLPCWSPSPRLMTLSWPSASR